MIRAALPVLLAWGVAAGQGRKCGTASLLAEPGRPLAKRSAAPAPVRTLATGHFLIHYVVSGPDQALLTEADSALESARDSLYALHSPSLGPRRLDSLVLAGLDEAGIPHPRYVQVAGERLEEAWSAYVDGLRMRRPSVPSASPYYGAPSGKPGRYPVDIADLGRVEPRDRGAPVYGYTYGRDGVGGMAIDNDFLYLAEPGADGKPEGSPITSQLGGKVLRDYSVEWEAGLAVTCFHEFYHAVQFAYTPGAEPYHVWYETGATAMEERLAPGVDDYLQYLPDLFRNLGGVGMLDYAFRPDNSRYGNAAYHLFLAAELGEGFDAALWGRLSANGNVFSEALSRSLSAAARTPGDVHVRYAARLAYSGRPFLGPYPPFAADLAGWPRLWKDTLDARAGAPYLAPLPPLSIRALALRGLRQAGLALRLPDTNIRPILFRIRGDSAAPEFPSDRFIPLVSSPGGPAGPDLLFLMLVNGSLDRQGSAELLAYTSREDTVVYAYPNPVDRASSALFFSRVPRPATVAILGENGRLIRSLSLAPETTAWTWDLTDAGGLPMKPGIYYYRVDAGPLRPLYAR